MAICNSDYYYYYYYYYYYGQTFTSNWLLTENLNQRNYWYLK